jgi:peroxiredoxin Q/BCP
MSPTAGTKAPDFSVKDTNGNTVTLSGLAGKKVVLYFYPKDDTPGCTKEACSFRDNQAAYQEKGIAVLGVSYDDETSHQAFTSKYNLNFPLLADTDGALAKAYGVDAGGYARRVTFLIDETGTILKVDSSVNTATHAEDILAELGV